MCDYAHIENIRLNNGKTVKEVNADVRKEVENIYLEGWSKGISIPFWTEKDASIWPIPTAARIWWSSTAEREASKWSRGQPKRAKDDMPTC